MWVAIALVCGLSIGIPMGYWLCVAVTMWISIQAHDADIERRNAELDAQIARGCRRTVTPPGGL